MSDQETKNRILDKALDHFLQFGFSKVTMNEIAEDLGMSKKTLYQYFTGKEELLLAVLNRMHTDTAVRIDALIDDVQMDFPEKLRSILGIVASFQARLTPHFLSDIQKHVPEAERCSDKFRNERMHQMTARLLDEGVQKGIFRNDLPVDLIALVYAGAVQTLLRPESLHQLSMQPSMAHAAVADVLFNGILTAEGRTRLHPTSAPSAVPL